jgi:uncharacterized membrane-anchored protein
VAGDGSTTASVTVLDDDARVAELSRMLSGHPTATSGASTPTTCSTAPTGARPRSGSTTQPTCGLRASAPRLTGRGRVDRRTKELVKRLEPGDIAVIDHEDLDRVAAETLIEAEPAAVVNAAAVDLGPLPQPRPLAARRGRHPARRRRRRRGMRHVASRATWASPSPSWDGRIRVRRPCSPDARQTHEAQISSGDRRVARRGWVELSGSPRTPSSYIRNERHLVIDDPVVPEVARRHTRPPRAHRRARDRLPRRPAAAPQGGYISDQEMRPVLIAVDGGADALLALGYRPDIIIGDFDSVSDEACAAGPSSSSTPTATGGHRAPSGSTSSASTYAGLGSEGTSEDIAMLLAYEKGASSSSPSARTARWSEFLDKGRAGMASTFLVRLKVGPMLVDAKGVSRLYKSSVRKRDLLMLVLAAVFTLTVIVIVSEPLRLVLRGYLLTF